MEEAEEKKIGDWVEERVGDGMRGHKLFMGQMKMEDMGWVFRTLGGCCGMRTKDGRDWEAIDEWADGIVKELRDVRAEAWC